MTLTRRFLLIAVSPLVLGVLPAAAQQAASTSVLPWQQGRGKPLPPQPAPKREVLPWLTGPETLPWAKSTTGARIETGAVNSKSTGQKSAADGVATNGLVLKTPVVPVAAVPTEPVPPTPPKPLAQAVPARDESNVNTEAKDDRDAAFEAEPSPAPLGTQAAPVAKAAPRPVAADVTAPVGPARAAAPAPAQASPAAAAQDGPERGTAAVSGRAAAANEPAPDSEPVVEEAPPIPLPLPEAIVTPVAVSDALQSKPAAPKKLSDSANVAQQYCFNIADAAKDARYAWQKKTLADIEQELNKRIALLDERTAEYQRWLARRDEFIRQAEDGVVKIYTGMRPDAAAVQLTLMQEETAAAILTKLGPRPASAILNEMEPAKAAKLTMIITGAAKLKKKQQQAGTPAAPNAAAPAAAEPRPSPQPATNGQRS